MAAGAPKPLARELIIADNVHGESGLDGPKLPDPAFAPLGMTGIELMARSLRESPEPVTLVPTGPLTNIALLLAAHPELKPKIARIVLMGAPQGLATGRLRRNSIFMWTRKRPIWCSSRVSPSPCAASM